MIPKKETVVVLRSKGHSARDIFLGPGLATPTAAPPVSVAEMQVETEEVPRNRIADLSRENDVLAIAPAVPFKLIEPIPSNGSAASHSQDDVTWGVTAVAAPTSPFTGDGVVVAVLDTGIDASHPAFQHVELVRQNFTNEGDDDENGHGTHCAGTIFGRETDGVRIGVAPGVRKAIIGKVLGAQGGSSGEILKAIQWAVDQGAEVISMSLGIDFPGLVRRLEQVGFPTELAVSRALEGYRANVQIFEKLASLIRTQASFLQSTVIVAAAGNESRRPNFEIGVSPPAVSEGIVSVAALGVEGQGLSVADFSNTGANVSGPGVDIVSAQPGGGLQSMNGTSMATPHVAGVAALWAEKIKQSGAISPLLLTSRLIGSAIRDRLVADTDPFDVGAGLVQAPQN